MFIVTVMRYFFFFKHKTAYEMRISDWSSDVCSSDLPLKQKSHSELCRLCEHRGNSVSQNRRAGSAGEFQKLIPGDALDQRVARAGPIELRDDDEIVPDQENTFRQKSGKGRSEEHTSELQSLMRISYAVFCLKKKNNQELN